MTIFVAGDIDKNSIMVYLSAVGNSEMNESIMINQTNSIRQQPKKELFIPYG